MEPFKIQGLKRVYFFESLGITVEVSKQRWNSQTRAETIHHL